MSDQDSTLITYGYCWCGCGQETPLAKKTSKKRDTMRGEPLKYIRGHNSYRQDPLWIEEDRGYGTPCYIWRRSFTTAGYGQITVNGKCILAHRHFYEKHVGPIPEDAHLHHRCDQPDCMNWNHQQPLTPAQHARTRKHIRLDDEETREAQRLYAEGGISYSALGRRFGISTMTAWNAVHRTLPDKPTS